MSRRLISIGFFLLILSCITHSQNEGLRLKELTIKDGLSQNSGSAIFQDHQGFLWIGTSDGLNKYDGNKFTIYNPILGDPSSISHNIILSIFEDTRQTLWIGTQGGGINRFNRSSETFQRFQHDPALTSSLSNNYIRIVFEDSQQNLWFGTDNGLNRFNRNKNTFSHFFPNQSTVVYSMVEYPRGTLWIGTSRGLFRQNNQSQGFSDLRNDPLLSQFINWDIRALAINSTGVIWIGSMGRGLAQVDLIDKKVLNHIGTSDDLEGLCSNNIHSLLYRKPDALWIGTDVGLHKLDQTSQRIVCFNRGNTEMSSSKNSPILSLFADRSDVLWIGTYTDGIKKFDLNRKKFLHFTKNPRTPNSLGGFVVWCIFEDSKKNLLVGTLTGGVTKIDRQNNRFTVYNRTSPAKYRLSANNVKTILEDSQGTIWIGTVNGGLNELSPDDKIVAYHKHHPSNRHSISNNTVRSIYEDEKGQLWLGTDRGLNMFNRQQRRFSHIYAENKPQGLSHNFVRVIKGAKNGSLWLGTYGGGLNLFNKVDGTCTQYKHQPGNLNSLSYNYILSLYQSKSGILWIGTDGGGLNGLNPSSGSFVHVMKQHGLPNNTIYGVLEDEAGNLWISHNKGLSRYHLHDKTIKNYDENDGLQSNEFCGGSFFKSGNGEMFFGGINGFNCFFPDEITDNQKIPILALTDFKIFNQSIKPKKTYKEKIILDHSLNKTKSIRISYRENFLTFEFAALHYVAPEKNEFAYMLAGLEDNWNYVGNRKYATYTTLPYGKYTLKVKAANNDGLWNERGISLDIIISPPFWKTWWFITLCILVTIVIVFSLYNWRIGQLEKRKKELLQLVDDRTAELKESNQEMEKLTIEAEEANRSKGEFLARMSHEILTPMNGIMGFSDMLMNSGLDAAQFDYAKTVHRSGEALISLLNDILDFSKLHTDELELKAITFDPEITVFDVCDLILHRLKGKEVEIICSIEDNVPAYVLGDAARFRQVLVNLMANAAKFTSRGEIKITLLAEELKNGKIQLRTEIRDTGKGIPADKIDTIFNVFDQAGVTSTRKYGFPGLGLYISKKISNLMGGDIQVDSEVGRGSTFSFFCKMEKSDKKVVPEFTVDAFAGKSILVADEKPDSHDIIARILKPHEINVTTILNIEDAISAIKDAAGSDKPFDMCIIDTQIKDNRGYRLAQEIRNLEPPAGTIKLLAFSSPLLSNSAKCLEFGFDGLLPKPAQKKTLLKMIEKLLGQKGDQKRIDRESELVTRHTIVEDNKHAMRILVVDDNPINLKLAKFILEKAGYQIRIAKNGQEAVEQFTSSPNDIDMIFMDIQMPIMNGREATRKIRELGYREVPIVAMTAETMEGDQEKCIEAGMNDYIPKPIRREAVFKIIKKWCLD